MVFLKYSVPTLDFSYSYFIIIFFYAQQTDHLLYLNVIKIIYIYRSIITTDTAVLHFSIFKILHVVPAQEVKTPSVQKLGSACPPSTFCESARDLSIYPPPPPPPLLDEPGRVLRKFIFTRRETPREGENSQGEERKSLDEEG